MASLKLLAASPSLSVARKEFGEGSVDELENLLWAAVTTAPGGEDGSGHQDDQKKLVTEFVEAVPHLSCFLAGAVQVHGSSAHARTVDDHAADELFTLNARATVKALHGLVIGPDVFISSYTGAVSRAAPRPAPESLQAFRQRVLAPDGKVQHLPAMLAANSSDVSALRFLAEVSAIKSAEEAAQAAKGPRGQEFVQTLRSSPTFASAVMFLSWWDDAWNWIKGAVEWLSDAAKAFGEEAAKVANAVVEGVFNRFPGLTKFLEDVPGVGLVVAGIYYIAGKTDQATAALAINLNAIVTVVATGIGFAVAGPAGAMIGGALGKAAGLLIQKAIAQYISDPKMRADVGDISATEFIIDVALSGAASGGAGAVAKALAEAAGMSAIKAFILSEGLPALLASLPAYLAKVAQEHTQASAQQLSPHDITIWGGPGPVISSGERPLIPKGGPGPVIYPRIGVTFP